MNDRSGRVFGRIAILLGACAWGSAHADDGGPTETPTPAIDRLVGQAVPDFSLPDAQTGKPVALAQFADQKAVVVVFTGIDCPVGNLYLPRLRELHNQFKSQGVAFLCVNSNSAETTEAIAAHAKEYQLPFPVLADPDGKVARQLAVERTCEALVIDAQAKLRYRGAIDDQYGYGVRKDKAMRPYLADALTAVLAGQDPETKATTVAGCPIDLSKQENRRPLPRVRPTPDEIVTALKQLDPDIAPESIGPVNYAQHVAPILQNRCQSCHRPGEVGPFPLLTYEDAQRRAGGILEVLETRRMPPWHADPRHGHFANDRRLTAKERATLTAWIDQDMPRGDSTCDPAPKSWPEGWTIGSPDLVLQMPKPYTVKAEGSLPYQRFRIKTGFTEDKWVQALEPRPGDRSVVHHIVIYLIEPGKRARSPENIEHLAAYAPGDLPTRLPDGTAKRIPAGSELIFEMHYTPTGKVRIDQSSLGIVFAKQPPKYRAVTMAVANPKFKIPPGASHAEVTSQETADKDLLMIGLLPHMHLRGKDFRYTAKYPDGREEVLLSVPRYDFAWQSYYWLAEPKPIPKGTVIHCVAHFDNSSANPALTEADTKQTVRWGEQTWEEMMIGFVDVLLPADDKLAANAGGE